MSDRVEGFAGLRQNAPTTWQASSSLPSSPSGAIESWPPDLGISSRYLRALFCDDNDNVSAYILRRRLEESATLFTEDCWRGLSITEIAFKFGFNSSSYFSRAFRHKYEMAASEYRKCQ